MRPLRASAGGFTLIEVLAAVAVVALALGAALNGASRYAANALYLQQKTQATWVARNRLVELHLAPAWPATGSNEGSEELAGRRWLWRTEVSATPDPKIRRVDVTVSTAEDKQPVAQLSGFLAPAPIAAASRSKDATGGSKP